MRRCNIGMRFRWLAFVGALAGLATATPVLAGEDLCQGLVTDQAPHPMTALAKPALGQEVVDPEFGTTIRRITAVPDLPGDDAIRPPRVTWSVWNADESMMVLHRPGQSPQLYDGRTYAFIRDLPITATAAQLFWHTLDPDKLYYIEVAALKLYRVSTNTSTLIRDFYFPAGRCFVLSANVMSWDSDRIGLECHRGGAFIWEFSTGQGVGGNAIRSGGLDTFRGPPNVAPTAALFHQWTSQTENDVFPYPYDPIIADPLRLPIATSSGSLGRRTNGTETFNAAGALTDGGLVGTLIPGGEGSLLTFDLATREGGVVIGPMTGWPLPSGARAEVSTISYRNPGWALVSVTGNPSGAGVLDNEIVLANTNNGDICRVAHSRTFGASNTNPGLENKSLASASAVLSPSGTRIAFASDWGNGATVDTYVIELPSYDPYTGAQLLSPLQDGVVDCCTATFTWTARTNVTGYWLTLGTSPGNDSLYNSGLTSSTSLTVSTLPPLGGTVHARLYSLFGDAWQFRDYTFTVKPGSAVLTSPSPGATLPCCTDTFTWTPGVQVSGYWLTLGSTPGSDDVYNSGFVVGSTSRTVSGLPRDGRTVYARLYSLIGETWLSTNATYKAASSPDPAVLTTPPPGSMLPGSSVTFGWTPGVLVTGYWLTVGTSVGNESYYNSGLLTSTTSALVSGLPTDGSTVHVRLYSRIGNNWVSSDYVYSAYQPTFPSVLLQPSPGSTLPCCAVRFTWSTGTDVSYNWLTVGSRLGGDEIHNSGALTATTFRDVAGLPDDGRSVYVRLYSLIGATWQYADYVFTATNYNAVLTAPTPGTLLPTTYTFQWTPGTNVTSYWLTVGDPPPGNDLSIHNSGPLSTTSRTVTGIPADGRQVLVRLYSLIGGQTWRKEEYTFTVSGP